MSVTARWVVDASGRANILRRKLGLGAGVDTGHHCNAAWIRLAGGLDFEDWTDDEEWLGRMPEKGLRIHSTIHLIQPGLLAVADPARVGPDLHRRLRRPALPPLGGDHRASTRSWTG